VDGAPLQVGVSSNLTLRSSSANFTGFFVLNAAEGALSPLSNRSRLWYHCGLGHTEKSAKSAATFAFTPTAAGNVTFRGYVHVDLKNKKWYNLRATLPIAPPAVALAPAPAPPPPASPIVRMSFSTTLTLRSVNFTKMRDPYNDLPNQMGRYYSERAPVLLYFSGSDIGYTHFLLRTNVTLALPAGASASSSLLSSVVSALAAAGGVPASALTVLDASAGARRRALLQATGGMTLSVTANVTGMNTTALATAATALSAAWSRNTTAAALAARLAADTGLAIGAADVALARPTASAVVALTLTLTEDATGFNATSVASTVMAVATSAALNTFLSGKGADVPPLGGITATPVVTTDLLAAANSSDAAASAEPSFCAPTGALCVRWSSDAVAGTVTWNVTARTRGYISIGTAERYNVMSPADVWAAWVDGSTGGAQLSHRRNDFGYDPPSLQAMPPNAVIHAASSSSGVMNTVFTVPLPAEVAAALAAGAPAPPVNFIWGVADAVPTGRDGELITHGAGIETDFGAALLNLLCTSGGDSCVVAAPREAKFTPLHAISLAGALSTFGAAAACALLRRRVFVIERIARLTLASAVALASPSAARALAGTGLLHLGPPELLLVAGYAATGGAYLARAMLMYPASPGRALGALLAPAFATALLPVARNSVVTRALGVSYERAVAFHRATGGVALVIMFAHVVQVCKQRGVGVLRQRTPNAFGDGNEYGTASAACFAALLLLAAPPLRRRCWALFKLAHLTLAPTALVLAILHARLMYPYLLPPLGLWLLDAALRWGRAMITYRARVCPLPHAGAVRLDVDAPTMLSVAGAGQFAYVALAGPTPMWHPLTCVPGAAGGWSFVVSLSGPKSLGARLAAAAAAAGGGDIRVRLDGPYGGLGLQLRNYDSVVLVAGGVGITPCVSVAAALAAQHRAGDTRLAAATLLWSVREADALTQWLPDWLPGLHAGADKSVFKSVQLHVTGSDVDAEARAAPKYVTGRPDVRACVRDAVATAAPERGAPACRVAVFACGPAGMVADAQLAAAACGCHFHAESFLL
jgi:NAD(P)H-flavin reductase